MKQVLNVGGNNKDIPLPKQFNGWKHVLLDIDPRGNPDIVCDARKLDTLEPNQFDAIYCSHNLEHYYHHVVPQVLAGFRHVLKPEGFVHARVPDMEAVMKRVMNEGLDLDDVLYQSPAGPILVRDVFWGFGKEIQQSGQDFYAHKTGFTRKSLLAILRRAGFGWVFTTAVNLEIKCFAFKQKPTPEQLQSLGLPALQDSEAEPVPA